MNINTKLALVEFRLVGTNKSRQSFGASERRH